MNGKKYIIFCDGGCYQRNAVPTPSYFSYQIWESNKLTQFYNNIKTRPLLKLEKFYLRSLIPYYHQESVILTDQLGKLHEIEPNPALFLPPLCSIYGELNVETNNIAEYAAIYYSLTALIQNLPYGREIELYSDSKLIINQINGEWKCSKPHLQNWLTATLSLVDRTKNLKIIHTRRDNIERILGH